MNRAINPVIPKNEEIRILIVDDDPIVLEVMKSFVASYGFNFATASDGMEAVELLEKQEFDIIISDINMPRMDGMELLNHVRQHHPSIGMIIITGISEEYSYVDVIRAGAIDYMTKPFDGQELLAKLQRVVREQALVSELEQLSICDSLTGLYNRRHFDTKLSEELHRAVRQGYSIFLAFLDVDKFKEYNDTFGHQAGDNLLATIGKILLSSARKGVDWVFRYGGDEFAIIVTQATVEQATMVLSRIMKSYQECQFGETSLSFGMAKFTRCPDKTWPEDMRLLMQEADKALYAAKGEGRNRIIVS